MESAHYDHVDKVGKVIRGTRYVHVSSINALTDTTRNIVERAASLSGLEFETDFNVVKIHRGNIAVSLLRYPMFFDEAFPGLDRSTIVDFTSRSTKSRTYGVSTNQPILHKKELLLTESHPNRLIFETLTNSLESIGLSPNKPGLGYRKQWNDYLSRNGVIIQGHEIVMPA